MDKGWRTGRERFKYYKPERWSRWPFAPLEQVEETGAVVNEPPGGMPPTEAVFTTTNSIELSWERYESRPDVPGDAADGYHLDICHLCPIDGPGEWMRAYKGNRTGFTVRGLMITRDLLARVRAYNRKGGGEWSEVRRYRVQQRPPKPPVEHPRMPALWRCMDIEDVIKQEKLDEGDGAGGISSDCSFALLGLLNAMHSHRTTIKVAWRYYTLVGSSGRQDADSDDSMNMQQFLHFAKSTSLLSEKEGMVGSDVDRIFLRSIRGEGEKSPHTLAVQQAMAEFEIGDDNGAKASAPAAASEWSKARGALKTGALKATGKSMLQHQFVAGLVRLANLRFASHPSLMDRFNFMCSEFLTRHVIDELDLLHDAFSKLMNLQVCASVSMPVLPCDRSLDAAPLAQPACQPQLTHRPNVPLLRSRDRPSLSRISAVATYALHTRAQPYLAVANKRKAAVERVFVVYAAADKSMGNAAASSTMNFREMSELCEDTKMFEGKVYTPCVSCPVSSTWAVVAVARMLARSPLQASSLSPSLDAHACTPCRSRCAIWSTPFHVSISRTTSTYRLISRIPPPS